jgi:hypothetical protein
MCGPKTLEFQGEPDQIDGYGRSDVGHFRLIYSTYLAHVLFRAPPASCADAEG